MECRRVELGRVVTIRNGTIDPSRCPDETFELFSIPGFDAGSPEVLVGRDIKSNKTAVMAGDVLFSKLNPRIPRVWIVPPDRGFRQISSTEFWPLVSDKDILDRQYLRYFLLSSPVRNRLSPSTEAATKSRSRIKPYQLLSERIPLPPISEQHRIVEILDQADRLRRLRAEVDAKADRILPALFIKMFGDP
ncbi:MAG TPA: restriction endonuclease subunit S, partial [Acidobacteria bacterium]|nr:restriction endonuclease subunit S [Acidobacteriota bacterium]